MTTERTNSTLQKKHRAMKMTEDSKIKNENSTRYNGSGDNEDGK